MRAIVIAGLLIATLAATAAIAQQCKQWSCTTVNGYTSCICVFY